MTPEQREELRQAAMKVGKASYSDPMTVREDFSRKANPAAILSLIAQVEALTRKEKALHGLADLRYAEVLELAAQLSEAMTVPQWISVETEPENDTAVIVLFWPYGNEENTQIAQSARYFDGSFIDEDGNEMHPPSHWMPFVFPTIPAIPGTKEGA